MMFRPKYCANCGEKVERVEWRIWTSRRFCELCETEYRHIDLFPIGSVAIGILLAGFGLSSYLSGPTSSANFAKVENPVNSPRQLKQAAVPPEPARQSVIANASASTANVQSEEIQEQPVRKINTSEDTVFYCGATTKKGTPCTRRVKTKGYCWQHAKTGHLAPTRF